MWLPARGWSVQIVPGMNTTGDIRLPWARGKVASRDGKGEQFLFYNPAGPALTPRPVDVRGRTARGGLLIIPGSTVIIPVVVAVAPWLLPSTFPQRQTWRDADVAAVFRQLDVDNTGRPSLRPATPLLAG